MSSITKGEFLKYAIDNDLLLTISFIVSVLGIPYETNKYVRIEDNGYSVNISGEYVKLEGGILGRPPLELYDEINAEPGFIPGLKEPSTTTVGRIIFFYIVVARSFHGKIPYLTDADSKIKNKSFVPADIENLYIAPMLGKEITIDEYISFVDACTYVRSFSNVIGISATEKSLLPPPGIAKKRKEVIAAAIEKYGPDALKSYDVIVEIENELKKFDLEWLKDDPSLDIVISGKIRDNARKKMFLMIGAEEGLKSANEPAQLIEASLSEGMPTDPASFAELTNSSRSGSHYRGVETFKGGLLGKILLRATNTVIIEDGDCGTNLTRDYIVTKDNAEGLVGRYIVVANKLKMVEDVSEASTYIGTTVKMRSLMYCNQPGEAFCKTCAGYNMTKSAVPLVVTDVAGIVLNASMKRMHNATMQSVEFDIFELLT